MVRKATDLVCYNWTHGRSCVRGNDNPAIELAADDCGSCARGFGHGDAIGGKSGIAVEIREIEARHLDGA